MAGGFRWLAVTMIPPAYAVVAAERRLLSVFKMASVHLRRRDRYVVCVVLRSAVVVCQVGRVFQVTRDRSSIFQAQQRQYAQGDEAKANLFMEANKRISLRLSLIPNSCLLLHLCAIPPCRHDQQRNTPVVFLASMLGFYLCSAYRRDMLRTINQ